MKLCGSDIMRKINLDILRTIKNSKIRFLSIFLISTLGLSTFISLNVLSIFMNNTIDNLYYKYNTYDIKISKNIKLNQDEIKLINNNPNFKNIEYGFRDDEYIKNTKNIISIFSMPKNISKLETYNYKKPSNKNEIIIDKKFENIYKINTYIELENDIKLKIVGYFNNIEYRLVDDSEISNKSYSKSHIIAYSVDEYFKNKKYDYALVKINDISNNNMNNEEYRKKVYKIKKEFENKLNHIKNTSLNKFKDENNEIIKKSKEELFQIKKDILDKEKYLNNTLINLKDEEKKLLEQKKAFDNFNVTITNAKEELEINNGRIKEGIKQLIEGEKELNLGYEKIEKGLIDIENNKKIIDNKKEELENNKKRVYNLKPSIFISEKKINEYKTKINEAEIELNNAYNTIFNERSKLLEIKNSLDIKKNELNVSKIELNDALLKIQEEENKLEIEILNYNKNYDKNKKLINNGLNKIKKGIYDIRKGINELGINKIKAFNEINENYNILIEEEKKLNEFDEIIYFVNTKFDNKGYISFYESISSLNIISKVFPIIFFSIVILVTSTTMSRMVDENRNIIGTYKFLGYNMKQISKKYYIYIFIPTIISFIFSIFIGTKYLPIFLYKAYSSGSNDLFLNLKISYEYKYLILSLFILLITNMISIKIALNNVKKENISNLLKVKINNETSNILLEKIYFIWNKLSFKNKIVLRNIFRYKTRMLMNLIGIIGSTALIFLGLSIRDSYNEITNKQFEEIFKYDVEVYLNDENIVHILDKEYDFIPVYKTYFKFKNNNTDKIIETFVKDVNLDEYINLKNDQDVIISERTLYLLNNNIEDKLIKIFDFSNNMYTLNVDNYFENFYSNFLFINKNRYEKIFNKKIKINTLLLKEKNKNKISKLLDYKEIRAIKLIKDDKENFLKISESLNYIVIFIIALSALLSIIVNYTLLDINISERKRELATIKVLGFYPIEVSLYIYKEILLLNLIGIIIGFIVGKISHNIILISMKNTNVVFVNNINLSTYVISALFTLIFSVISMLLMHKKINKIKMIESLKME